MQESENIGRIIDALRKVPKKELLIIELANRACTDNGQLDLKELEKIQPEVNLAIAEAKMYGAHTMIAVQTLKGLQPAQEQGDVRP